MWQSGPGRSSDMVPASGVSVLIVQACAQAAKAGEMGDDEYLRLAAEDAEFKRAKERLTLKHKNTSQWARRALKRGVNVMDEGASCR